MKLDFSPFTWLWVLGAIFSFFGAYASLRQPLYSMGIGLFGFGCVIEAYVEQNQVRGTSLEVIGVAFLIVGGVMQLWSTVKGRNEP